MKLDKQPDETKEQKGLFLFHPFLFCLMPMLSMLQIVKEVVMPETIVPAIIVLELETALVYLLSFLFFRDFGKAALFTTVLNFILFSYMSIEAAVNSMWQCFFSKDAPAAVPLLVHALLAFAILAGLFKKNWVIGKRSFELPLANLSLALNPVSAILLVLNVYPVVSYYFHMDSMSKPVLASFHKLCQQTELDKQKPRPDIYYIIVDGCAHPQTLLDVCGYDNSQFTDFLKSKGFYIAERASSNYDRTEYSLASSFNMQYLDQIPEKIGKEVPGYFIEWRLVHDSCLQRLLASLGYRFINICSFSTGTDFMPGADTNLRTSFGNHFMIATALLGPLRGLESYIPALRELYVFSQLKQAAPLAQVVQSSGPKFVFLHTELTHPPYLFDQNGNKRPLPLKGMQSDWRDAADYGQQVAFAEHHVEKWVSTILENSKEPPVIILQADHGPGPFQTANVVTDESKAGFYTAESVRMKILSAYYLPSNKAGVKPLLYEEISPVNSFRVVLDQLFSAHLPLLPDRALFPESGHQNQYDWKDIREKVIFKLRS